MRINTLKNTIKIDKTVSLLEQKYFKKEFKFLQDKFIKISKDKFLTT